MFGFRAFRFGNMLPLRLSVSALKFLLLRAPVLRRNAAIHQRPNPLDGADDLFTLLEIPARITRRSDSTRCPGEDQVARLEGAHARQEGDELSDGEDHAAGARVL